MTKLTLLHLGCCHSQWILKDFELHDATRNYS